MDSLLDVLHDSPNRMVALLIETALYTGLRRGELFKLKRKDVDLDSGNLALRDPKGGPDVMLPISLKVVTIMKEARKLRPHSVNVFPNKWGRQRTTLSNTWPRIRAAAGIPKAFRFHDLRHTYASYLASSGEVQLYTLQRLLGHKTAAMTQRYAHLSDRTLRAGAEVLSSIFSHSKD